MSIPPNWLNQIQFLIRVAIQGCEPPFSVFAQYAWPTAKRITMMLIETSMDDIVKEAFRPKGSRSGRHMRKTLSDYTGIPDMNEKAGRDAGEALGTQRMFRYSALFKEWLVFDDVMDRIGWTVFLVENLTDLTFDGTLGALGADRSKCPTTGRAHIVGDFSTFGGAGPQWQIYPSGEQVKFAKKVVIGGGFNYFLPDGQWSITLGAYLRAPNGAGPVGIRLLADFGGPIVEVDKQYVDVPATEKVDIIVDGLVNGPATIWFENDVQNGFCDTLHSDLTILEIGLI